MSFLYIYIFPKYLQCVAYATNITRKDFSEINFKQDYDASIKKFRPHNKRISFYFINIKIGILGYNLQITNQQIYQKD